MSVTVSRMNFTLTGQTTVGVRYRCATCKRWWEPNAASVNVSCCVQHAPGDCCHFMEIEVAKKGWRKRLGS